MSEGVYRAELREASPGCVWGPAPHSKGFTEGLVTIKHVHGGRKGKSCGESRGKGEKGWAYGKGQGKYEMQEGERTEKDTEDLNRQLPRQSEGAENSSLWVLSSLAGSLHCLLSAQPLVSLSAKGTIVIIIIITIIL